MKYQLTDVKLKGKPAFMVRGKGRNSEGSLLEKDSERSTSRSRAINRFVNDIAEDIRETLDAGNIVYVEAAEPE